MSKELLLAMRQAGYTEHGAEFSSRWVRETAGIHEPTTADMEGLPVEAVRDMLNAVALAELDAVDYCRNVLLGEGKYLKAAKQWYRILMPGENKAQVEAYMRSSDSKLKRGLKLSVNTPRAPGDAPSNHEALIRAKLKGARNRDL